MVTSQGPNGIGRLTRQRGFTLIELLVALVVLVIGIYGMLRVFPPGYGAIEAGEQQTTAAQLADAELARWRLDPETLPDAVIATDYSGQVIPATLTNNAAPENLARLLVWGGRAGVLPGSEDYRRYPLSAGELAGLDQVARSFIYSPTDLTASMFDSAQIPAISGHALPPAALHPNWEPNSLYLPRTIVGERIDIRRLGQTLPGVPFYLLSHPPLDVLRYEGEDDPRTPEDDRKYTFLDVYDARPWRYVPGYPQQALEEREFSIDANYQLYFGPTAEPPTVSRSFKVDYTDVNTRRRVLGVTVTISSGNGPGLLPLGAVPDPNTIQVSQRLVPLTEAEYNQCVAGTLAWPRTAYYVNAMSAVSGRILFSPFLQSDPQPTDITVVKVDYRVADWQILAFDVEVPRGGMVQLPVRSLKSAGYRNPPRQGSAQEIARGVRRFFDGAGVEIRPVPAGALSGELPVPMTQVIWATWVNDPRSWAHVVAVDRQSGEILTDNETVDWPANSYMRRTRFRVDYKEGLLYFNYDPMKVYGFNPMVDTPDRAGRTYRIFCRAQNDWAVQLSLAARQYARSATGLPGGAPTGFQPTLLTYAWRPEAAHRRQLYFPLSDAGQSVVVDYYYHDDVTGREIYVSGEVHDIAGPNVTALGEWLCPLREELLHEPNDWGPTSVRGLSVRARVTWVTRGRSPILQDMVETFAMRRLSARAAVRPTLQEDWHQVLVTTYLTRAPI